MTRALERARFDLDTGEAVWVEEDYRSPPLAMERAEVLDDCLKTSESLRRTSMRRPSGSGSTTYPDSGAGCSTTVPTPSLRTSNVRRCQRFCECL